jgi:hypothetical protein
MNKAEKEKQSDDHPVASNDAGVDAAGQYHDLIDAVHGEGAFSAGGAGVAGDAGDVYQALMRKEGRVLDTVDRVVNDRLRTDGDRRSLLQLPLHVIGIRLIRALRGIVDDLVEARNVEAAVRAFTREDRRVYLGALIVLLALLVAAVDASC